MSFRENSINDFFNSKEFALVIALLVAALAYVETLPTSFQHTVGGSHGVFFSSLAQLVTSHTLSVTLNALTLLAIALLMVILNKTFNFIRSVTWIYASVFMLLSMVSPFTSSLLYSGTIMCLALILAMFAMFASFQRRRSQRNVFASFALISLLSMFQYAYLYLLLALLLGYMLMQVMNLRSAIAMVIGIITPFWIVLGLGFAQFSDFCLPSFQSIWSGLEMSQMQFNIVYLATLSVLTVVLTVLNLLKIINYKLQVRAYNGFFVYLTVLTVVMLGVDYRNAFLYLPMLNLCFGVQFGHFYTINSHTRRYIAVILLLAAAVALRVTHYFI
ncbi:MAG: hypothetical protein ACI308_07990 [Muribaculaceae bacterium]